MSASPATLLSSGRRIKNPVSKAQTNAKPGLGAVLSTATVGFLSSSRKAHSTEESWSYERLKPSVDAFQQFMKTSGLDLEISSSMNLHLLPRLALLSQINRILNKRNDRRELATIPSSAAEIGENEIKGTATSYRETITATLPTSQEALRYMRYATACYGSEMIRAAQIGKNNNNKKKKSPPSPSSSSSKLENESNNSNSSIINNNGSNSSINSTNTATSSTSNSPSLLWISDHIGIPPDDIVLLDVDYVVGETNHNHLRHFVAIDHAHAAIVLAIRGTYNLSEIVVDITAFSLPCEPWGGEAHAEILGMAKRLWHQAVGSTILQLLQQNPGYELILTGHSLGAGVACILNMMMQYCLKQQQDHQEQEPEPQRQQNDNHQEEEEGDEEENNLDLTPEPLEKAEPEEEEEEQLQQDDDNHKEEEGDEEEEDNLDLTLEDQKLIRQVLQNGQHKIRCFSFACPPLYTPLELIPEAVQSTTNYILEQDIVPFLSVDSVRHVFHSLRAMEDYIQTKMTTTQKMNLTLARTKPPQELINVVHQTAGCRLAPKDGAPVLSIPARANIWMKECPCGEYDFEPCDSMVLSWLGLNVDVQYFPYHLPPRYEHALEHLMDEI